MVLSFDSEEIRDYCETRINAVNSFGENVAKKLRNRISELSDTSTFGELPPYFWVPVNNQIYRVALTEGYYLYFSSGHARPPLNGNGEINWKTVSRIKLLDITNSHD